jgi:surfeit locus 1 family protein
MFSLSYFKYRFTPNWRMSLVAILSIAFFCYLGSWQLHRAKEKKNMLVQSNMLANQLPAHWVIGMDNPLQYQPIYVTGYYLPDIFLVDNQHYQHQFGYHVLTPLVLSGKKVILIDQGWVRGDNDRHRLPIISPVIDRNNQPVTLTGQAYYPSTKNWLFGDLIDDKKDNITVIELIDTQLISQFLHKSVYPFIIRLNKAKASGYVREWDIVAMSPERHNAYAFQWFAMALAVAIIFICLNLTKIDNNCET